VVCADATAAKERLPHVSSCAVSSSGTLKRERGDYGPRNLPGILFAITIFALATHFLYFSHFRNYYATDSPSYITPAFNLIHGTGFAGPDGRPETSRTPGYPLLIVPFLWAGLNLKYLVVLQHMMQVVLTVATAAAAFHIFASRRQTILVGILLAIDLPMLSAANTVLTETLFTVTLTAVLWLLWTGSKSKQSGPLIGWVGTSGLLAGAAVLIRPIGLYFFLPATAYLLLTRKQFRLRSVLTFVVAFSCFPLLWAARNYHQSGFFSASSAGGGEMLCCRAAAVLAINDPGDFNSNLTQRRVQLESTACANLKAIYGKGCDELTHAQKSNYEMRVAEKILLQNPLAFLKVTFRGAAVMLLDGDPSSLQGMTGINPHLGIRLLLAYTVPAVCLAVLGLWRFWGNNRQLFYLCFLTMAYFVVISSGGDSYSRHRVPFAPVYALLIAAGVDYVLTKSRSSASEKLL
jgi:hypothetical protein